MPTTKLLPTAVAALVMLVAAAVPARAGSDPIVAELDRFWAGISRYGARGDLAGMKSAYHPDAVLVDGTRGLSYPIAEAFDRWADGLRATRDGEMEASVSFRFGRRLHDDTTAHETGIFHYTEKPQDGERTDVYIHFEALLVKRNGWKMIMEYQKRPATAEEWAALL